MKQKYSVIGIMSGTSLDGLDIAHCIFVKDRSWSFSIRQAETIKYSPAWRNKLSHGIYLNKKELSILDSDFGMFIGSQTAKFIRRNKIRADLIASHGHTVFHQPAKGITLQIGSGKQIADQTGLPVVCDFRSGDVALGGQGAPLVPLVDRLLFHAYTYCLNLGGFANISYENGRKRIAFDICPVNIVLNELAGMLGKEFDKGGKLASEGKLDLNLLNELNRFSFYSLKPPKSLGREWVEKIFLPVLRSNKIPVKDKLRTVVEHAAIQIASSVNGQGSKRSASLLITGGGAYNKFLVKRISTHTGCRVKVPNDKTIQFKEAMAFALLGVLKSRGEINILRSVTGARKDSSGGRIFRPDQKAESSL